MANTFKIKRGDGAPSNAAIDNYELVYDYTNNDLWTKHSGSVVKVASGNVGTVTNVVAGTGLSGGGTSTATLNVDAAQTQITSIGTIGTGVWQGTAIADGYLGNAILNSGSWNATGFAGSRYKGLTINSGELSIQRDHPNSGQVSLLVDGGYSAGENNGFWSLYSGNNWANRVGFYSNTSGVGIFNTTASAGDWNFQVAGSSKMYIDGSASRVGINTTTPEDALHVHGTSGTTQVRIKTTANASANIRYQNDQGSFVVGMNSADQFSMWSTILGATTTLTHTNGDFYNYYNFLASVNNKGFYGRDTAGAVRGVAKIDNANNLQLGDAGLTGDVHCYPATRFQINTDDGYCKIGPENPSYNHILTDRPTNYFDKSITTNGGTLSSYNQDLLLQRSQGTSDMIKIQNTYTTFYANGAERFRVDAAGADVTGFLTATSTISTNYGVSFLNGNTNFLFYNNTGDNLFYLRDITNGQMLQTWTPNSTTIHKPLYVTGNLQTGSTSNPSLTMINTATGSGSGPSLIFGHSQGGTTQAAKIKSYLVDGSQAGRAGHLDFYTTASGSSVQRMRIHSSGAVGIGVTGERIHLNQDGTAQWGSAAAHGRLTWDTGQAIVTTVGTNLLNLTAVAGQSVVVNNGQANVDFRVKSDTTNDLIFADAGNVRVGIGTDSPGSLLTVYKDGTQVSNPSTSYQIMTVSNSNGGIAIQAGASSDAFLVFGDYGQYDAGRIRYHNSTHHMDFCTGGNNPRMTIQDDGHIAITNTKRLIFDGVDGNTYINQNSGSSSRMDVVVNGSGILDIWNNKLVVNGYIDTNDLYIAHGGSDYTPGIIFLGGSDTAGSNSYENAHIAYYDNAGTGTMLFEGKRAAMNWAFIDADETLFLMASDGDFHAHQDVVAYSTSAASDKKFKENIKTIPYGLNEVLKMNPVEFDWKEKRNKAHDIGVIAQEIEKIIPEVVKESKELNSDETFKSVDYSKMVAVLIKAVQEQQVQIDELKDCQCQN